MLTFGLTYHYLYNYITVSKKEKDCPHNSQKVLQYRRIIKKRKIKVISVHNKIAKNTMNDLPVLFDHFF